MLDSMGWIVKNATGVRCRKGRGIAVPEIQRFIPGYRHFVQSGPENGKPLGSETLNPKKVSNRPRPGPAASSVPDRTGPGPLDSSA